jgi:hypothetical protein
MLIQKQLLEKLISLASDSAEYLNSAEHWITVHPHGSDSKGTHLLVKDGETSKQAVDRKFGDGDKKEQPLIGKKYIDNMGREQVVIGFNKQLNKYLVQKSERQDQQFGAVFTDEKEINKHLEKSEERKKYYEDQDKKIKEEQAIEEQKIKEYKDIKGFADDKPEMQRGKIIKSLNNKINYNGEIVTKKQFIENVISKEKAFPEEGMYKKSYDGVSKKRYSLKKTDGKFYEISKTEFDYAQYLVTK